MLSGRKFYDEHFQLRIFHLNRMDRDIFAKSYFKKKRKQTEKSSIFAYCKEFCSLKGRVTLTSEHYLACRKFHEEHFQLRIFHLNRIDRDIFAKNH